MTIPGYPIEVDLLLLGGRLLTTQGSDGPLDAMAIANGRILATGRAEAFRDLPARQTLHLEGKWLAPGFIDAHCHFILYCMALRLVDCRTPLDGDLSIVLEGVSQRAQVTPPGEWIKGWGFADYKVSQRRYPTRAELDEAAPRHPVAVVHASWHTAVLNSLALQRLGIDAQTPDPPGGEIERAPHSGEPTGLIHETAMQSVSFESMIAEFVSLPVAEQMAALQIGSDEFASYGLTSICDAMMYPSFFGIYQEASRRGVLKFRVQAMPFYDACQAYLDSGLTSGFGSDRLQVGPVKLLGDGSLSGRTAAVSQPFVGGSSLGVLIRDDPALQAIVRELDGSGQRISIHAIGDRAVSQVVAAYRHVIDPDRGNPKRHRLEHAGILSPELVDAMAELDIVVATQPRMLYEQGDGFYRSCGAARVPWVYPYRALIEAGLHVAGSSDCPVVSANPLLGMRAGVTRRTEAGEVLAPEQCLAPAQALHMWTTGAAYALGEEQLKGALRPGMLADIAVLSGDLLAEPPETWGEALRVVMTITGGDIVFQDPSLT